MSKFQTMKAYKWYTDKSPCLKV